jgi:hypothetical protein
MKSLNELLDESRERGKTRFAERKEIEAKSFSVRCEARRANEEIGQETMAAVTFEALSTAERAIHKVDQAIETPTGPQSLSRETENAAVAPVPRECLCGGRVTKKPRGLSLSGFSVNWKDAKGSHP